MYVTRSPEGWSGQECASVEVRQRRTDLQCRNELRQRNKKEIEVEEELELLVEDDRQEGECVVLLVADDIWREPLLKFLCADDTDRSNRCGEQAHVRCDLLRADCTSAKRTCWTEGYCPRFVFPRLVSV